MQLSSLGFGDVIREQLELLRTARNEPRLEAARVIAEHRGAYQLLTEAGACTAELTGKLRHDALDRRDLPAVGDWVALGPDGRVEAVLPRKSVFVRKQAGQRPEPQVVAANIDYAFVVTSANADFNPRRIERYLSAIAESGAQAVIVINKADLCDDVQALVASLGPSSLGVPVACVSALEQRGLEQLEPYLEGQPTIALVGSSGVGKSTIVNWLIAGQKQATAPIREHDARGRHTTTHRELHPLPAGGALIDTPGMRELAVWADEEPTVGSFDDIEALGKACRFVDCQHHGQPGCAIERAVADGTLDPARLAHYEKLQREVAHARSRGTPAEREKLRSTGRARSTALRQSQRGRGKPT
jgi:ribosome biogenesis GTPase / thiamine phosphate phosphatase